MKLVGASSVARVSGLDELPGKSNYFIGNDPNKWRTNVPTYARAKYQAIYPGVDLVFYGNQRQLEHDFVVAPGADPSTVAFRLQGSKEVSLDAGGNLVIAVDGGEVRFERPLIYQETNGARREIPGGYVLKGPREVAFSVGTYDPTRPLVIDPVLVYSTYLGGSGHDEATSIALDASGNAYVAGLTTSSDFPTTGGAFQETQSASSCAFVTKIAPDGSSLVYSTYLGGSGGDARALGIAVDSLGNAYVKGETDAQFPTTPGAFQRTFGGGRHDAFVTKLNPTGSGLVYSTFLGGSGDDYADISSNSIAVDSAGSAYVVGGTDSTNFPTTPGAFDRIFGGGGSDNFVTKLSADGSALVYSTYLGGSGWEEEYIAIAIDSSGNAYVTGGTNSTDFPTTPGAYRTSGSGVFVTKLNAAGSALAYSTYLTNDSDAYGEGIAVDTSGNAYVTGYLGFSTDIPTTPGAFQTVRPGGYDTFVTKLNATGSALVYSTYLGGSGTDEGYGVAVDESGTVYVTGTTDSIDFPTTPGAIQSALGGGSGDQDAFMAWIDAAGHSLVYSTYLGGSREEKARGIGIDRQGNAYVVGETYSTDFPTANPFQAANAGAADAYVAKVAITPEEQVANLQNTVMRLVSDGTLGAGLGQFLLAPLNTALAALGSGPATGTVAAIDPGQATGRAAFDHGPATLAPAALNHRHIAAAIRDLNEFIGRVRLLVLFRRLKPAEGRILIALANGIITALRV
jgi:hypothetical protein